MSKSGKVLLVILRVPAADNSATKGQFARRPSWMKQQFPRDDVDPGSFRVDPGLDMAHEEGQDPLIPPYIHQVWLTPSIPHRYWLWMQKWSKLHPNWQYWFWSLEDVRKLVRTQFPEYESLFERYPSDEHRLVAARYFIMYHHGGVFADLDVEPLRPLDNWTYNYQCVLSQETEEHMFILRHQVSANILNSLLLCRSQHPFFKRSIDLLSEHAAKLDSAGAAQPPGHWFLQDVYTSYANLTAHVQGWQRHSDFTIVPAKYFFPTFNISDIGLLMQKCNKNHRWQLSPQGQVLCLKLQKDNFAVLVPKESYTNYHWPRISWSLLDKTGKNSSVFEIVPRAQSLSNQIA